MSLVQTAIYAGERIPWPDAISNAAIEWLVSRTRRKLANISLEAERAFAEEMKDYPIAVHTDEANAQHYEVPAEFFSLVLGPQRKYSCCLYSDADTNLAAAEEHALRATARNADIMNGQRILELGCGWGSLTLWMARHFPAAQITSVSNSHSQREFIMNRARHESLYNVEVITADMNNFKPEGRFDRVVSIEMFEHMANWRPLLRKAHAALVPGGKLFIHIFTHKRAPYRFSIEDKEDWIAQHFFTGGIMPSHGLIRQFPDQFSVEEEWHWNGSHYERTARDWLKNFDRNSGEVTKVLARVYGKNSRLWQRRWRLFFLATMGLFGHANGEEWGVSHYRLIPA